MTPDFRSILNFGVGLWALLAALELIAHWAGSRGRCGR